MCDEKSHHDRVRTELSGAMTHFLFVLCRHLLFLSHFLAHRHEHASLNGNSPWQLGGMAMKEIRLLIVVLLVGVSLVNMPACWNECVCACASMCAVSVYVLVHLRVCLFLSLFNSPRRLPLLGKVMNEPRLPPMTLCGLRRGGFLKEPVYWCRNECILWEEGGRPLRTIGSARRNNMSIN